MNGLYLNLLDTGQWHELLLFLVILFMALSWLVNYTLDFYVNWFLRGLKQVQFRLSFATRPKMKNKSSRSSSISWRKLIKIGAWLALCFAVFKNTYSALTSPFVKTHLVSTAKTSFVIQCDCGNSFSHLGQDCSENSLQSELALVSIFFFSMYVHTLLFTLHNSTHTH